MLKYFRKWSIALKRRRLSKEREQLKRYVSIEEDTRGDGIRCNNCRAPLTGPFCHICGQRDDDLRRPIWTFFRELFDALFDTDSKIIKTILMLVLIPGGLSRAFMEGKRARFLPPFRLYVVLLFVFFSVISIANILIIDIHVEPKAEQVAAREAFEAQMEAEIANQMAGVEKAREEANAARDKLLENIDLPEGSEVPELELVIDGPPDPDKLAAQIREQVAKATLQQSEQSAAQILKLLEAVEQIEAANGADSAQLRSLLGDIAEQVIETDDSGATDVALAKSRVRELLENPDSSLTPGSRGALEAILAIDPEAVQTITSAGDGQPGFSFGELPYNFDVEMFVRGNNEAREGIKQEDIDFVLQDPNTPEIAKKATLGFAEGLRSPREFNKLFNEWLPWALVILMPVFAGILRLTHWGKRRYYLNQLVFALHFHSFLFVMMTVFAFIVPAVGGENAFGIFWWGTSLYLIIALKVGQDQGWIRAFFKAGFIWVSYFAIMMMTMTIVMFLGITDSSLGELWDLIQAASDEAEARASSVND